MPAIRIFQVISILIGITAFVTGKDYIGDVTSGDISEVIAFIFSVVWAGIKLIITYIVLIISIVFSIPILILDFTLDENFLAGLWSWSWSTVAVDWFWYQTEGIKLFFAFLMSTAVGFFFDEPSR